VNPRRLTFSDSYDNAYDWTSDSKSVLFDSNRNGTWDIFRQALDQGAAEKLVAGGIRPAMGPDGISFLYFAVTTSWKGVGPARIARVALEGGPPQSLGDVQNARVIRCARTADLCVVSEPDRKEMVLYAVDPVKGKGRELLRVSSSSFPEHTIPDWDWDVSPDASSVALATQRAQEGIIQIHRLADGAVRKVNLAGWANVQHVRWSADGKGWYLIAFSTKQKGTTRPSLLRVDLEGKVEVLRQESDWAEVIPSPDGRHLALNGPAETRNVWMLENF
jgi:Tol biopolymer transport system component